jgi:hypothetical protein
MNVRRTKRLIPRLEAMEERLPLSAAAPTFHGVTAAHLRQPPHNPVILNLDPQATGIQITSATINRQFGVIGIQGIATFPAVNPPPYYVPPGPMTATINVTVTQRTGPHRSVYAVVSL